MSMNRMEKYSRGGSHGIGVSEIVVGRKEGNIALHKKSGES